jgi:hypothetical protein
MTWHQKAAICPSAGQGFIEHVLVAAWKGAIARRWIVGTRFHSNKYDRIRNALHTESHQYLGSAYRNACVHMTMNHQSTVTAKNTITLLLKEMISILFDQNLPQGENWPTEDRIQHKTEYDRAQKTSEEEVRSQVFILYGVVMVTIRVLLLFVVTKCYSKIVLHLIVVLPGEYPINGFT